MPLVLQGVFCYVCYAGGYSSYPPRGSRDAQCSEISACYVMFRAERSEIRQYARPKFPRFQFFTQLDRQRTIYIDENIIKNILEILECN